MWYKHRLFLVTLAAVFGSLAYFGEALADEFVKFDKRWVVWSSRADPQALVRQLNVLPPRPLVALTLEDAVAKEILQGSALSEVDAMRTAQTLCAEARRLSYDPLFFVALMAVESGFDTYAVSPVGAQGLMQLLPSTGTEIALRQGLKPTLHAFDPEVNVRLGVRYFAELHRRFGRLDTALTAYNRGPGATRSLLKEFGRLPDSVRGVYASKVLRRYDALKAVYGELFFG